MRYSAIAVIALLGMSSAPAWATDDDDDCEARFGTLRSTINFDGITVGVATHAEQSYEVAVEFEDEKDDDDDAEGGNIANDDDDTDECGDLHIRIGRVDAGVDPDTPPYSVFGPAGPVDILANADAGGTSRSDIAVPPGEFVTVPLQFQVDTGWGLKAGTYTERLRFTLLDGISVLDTEITTLTITIPPAITVRIIGAIGMGEGARVDLGSLSPDDQTHSDPFGALILSTSPYSVSFRSDNLGRLVHESGADSMPYELYFEGQLVNLVGPNLFPFPQHTPSGGDTRQLAVTVPPANAIAGYYRDRVTVTVAVM